MAGGIKSSEDIERKLKNYDGQLKGRNDTQPKSYIAPFFFQSGAIINMVNVPKFEHCLATNKARQTVQTQVRLLLKK